VGQSLHCPLSAKGRRDGRTRQACKTGNGAVVTAFEQPATATQAVSVWLLALVHRALRGYAAEVLTHPGRGVASQGLESCLPADTPQLSRMFKGWSLSIIGNHDAFSFKVNLEAALASI
jgi:hypothetical protein